MNAWRFSWVIVLAMGMTPIANALEFRSIKETGAVLYEAPVLTAKKLFVLSRGYPVEVLSIQREWARVRDATGGIAWIPTDALSNQSVLLVVNDKAEVREAGDAKSRLLFSVVKDGVLEMVEQPKAGWVKIMHRDGSQGYIRITDVWGL